MVRRRNLLHRGVGILCRNSAGKIHVHRRTMTKDVFPGLHDMLVGGVVGRGESFEDAARREIEEELGIAGAAPEFLCHHLYLGPQNRSLVAVYRVVWDGPVRLQEEEIAWGAYLSREELERRLQLREWTFVPDGLEIWERLRRDGY
jgi:isopentenyldiphosphate isomerase